LRLRRRAVYEHRIGEDVVVMEEESPPAPEEWVKPGMEAGKARMEAWMEAAKASVEASHASMETAKASVETSSVEGCEGR
jgi:hypothetical protein